MIRTLVTAGLFAVLVGLAIKGAVAQPPPGTPSVEWQ